MRFSDKAKAAEEFIKKNISLTPSIGIILGSGLGSFAENIKNGEYISYDRIPYFIRASVKGHKGRLSMGEIKGLKVVIMEGRIHYYEGYSMPDITFPVMVIHRLGIKSIFVTNAAGGINPDFNTGDIMLIKDHINMMGVNPLFGITDDEFEPFVVMKDAYDKGYIELAKNTAIESGIKVKSGVLAAITGPVYETQAEIEMLRRLGADAVCMSTIPEVIMARALNMRVFGVSFIANMAGGIARHEDVVKESEKNIDKFGKILTGVIEKMSNETMKQ